jgi:hypothetical protein
MKEYTISIFLRGNRIFEVNEFSWTERWQIKDTKHCTASLQIGTKASGAWMQGEEGGEERCGGRGQ